MRLMDGVPDLQKECEFYDSKLAELQVPRPLGVSVSRCLGVSLAIAPATAGHLRAQPGAGDGARDRRAAGGRARRRRQLMMAVRVDAMVAGEQELLAVSTQI